LNTLKGTHTLQIRGTPPHTHTHTHTQKLLSAEFFVVLLQTQNVAFMTQQYFRPNENDLHCPLRSWATNYEIWQWQLHPNYNVNYCIFLIDR